MPNMKSIQLEAKELQSYKVNVAISAHVADVADRLRYMEIALIQHIPIVPKDKCAMHYAYDNSRDCKKTKPVY